MSFASKKEIALAIVDYMLASEHRVLGSGPDDDQRYERVQEMYTKCLDEQRDNNWLIYGDVQSGKSSEMTAQTAISVAFGQRVVVVVRNSLLDGKQFADNLRATSNDIRDHLQEKFGERFDADKRHAKLLIHPTVKDSDGTKQDMEENSRFFSMIRKTNVLVVLANEKGIGSVGDDLRGDYWDITDDIRSECKVNIIVDEYDVLSQQVPVEESGERRRGATFTKQKWNELYLISTLTFHVTATPLAAMAEDSGARLNVANTIIVQPHPDYRGVSTLKHVSPEPERNVPENLDAVLQQLLRGDKKMRKTGCPGLLDTINNLSTREVYPNHPTILLAKCKTDTVDHERLCRLVHTIDPGRWATIAFNSKGTIIESHTLPDNFRRARVRYQVGDRSATVAICKKEITTSMTTQYTLNCGIKEALQILKTVTRSGSDGAPQRIFIAAGILADRGLNFVSEDYQWHITDEYLHMPSSACSDRMVQGLRILGRHTIKTPLLIWCNAQIWETIRKYQGVVKTYLDESQDQTDTWGDRFKQVIFNKGQLPNRPIGPRPKGSDMASLREAREGEGANVDRAVFNSHTARQLSGKLTQSTPEQFISSTQLMGVDGSPTPPLKIRIIRSTPEQPRSPIQIMGVDRNPTPEVPHLRDSVQETMYKFRSLMEEPHRDSQQSQHRRLVKHLQDLEKEGKEIEISTRKIENLLTIKFEGAVRDRFTKWYSEFDDMKRKNDHSRNCYRILWQTGPDSFILSTDARRLIKEVEDQMDGREKEVFYGMMTNEVLE